MTKQVITVKIQIHAPIEKVWSHWTDPECIKCWNQASDDWHTTKAENDLTVGGKFLSRMEAKDGSFGFDFEGIYNSIEPLKKIEYTLSDGRKCSLVLWVIRSQRPFLNLLKLKMKIL